MNKINKYIQRIHPHTIAGMNLMIAMIVYPMPSMTMPIAAINKPKKISTIHQEKQNRKRRGKGRKKRGRRKKTGRSINDINKSNIEWLLTSFQLVIAILCRIINLEITSGREERRDKKGKQEEDKNSENRKEEEGRRGGR